MDLVVSRLLTSQGHRYPLPMDDVTDLAAWTTRRDDAAFARLIQRHAGLVMGICRRRLGGSLADEAAQAVFIILAERASRVANPGCLGAWLHGVAIRVCIKAQRTNARRANHEQCAARIRHRDSEPEPEPEPEVAWSDLRPHLDEAIAVLSMAQRVAVVGHFLEGLPQSAVAERLGISEAAVHQRIQYALGKLRAWFGKRGMPVSLGALLLGLSGEIHAADPAVMAACTQAALHPASAVGAAALANGLLVAGPVKLTAGILLSIVLALLVGVRLWRAADPAWAFREDFERDGQLSAAWYDNRTLVSSLAEHAPSSRRSAEYHFLRGAETPSPGGPSRRMFPATEVLTIGYWMKYSADWPLTGGSFLQFLIMTNKDGAYDAPSYTHLTCAIGVEQGVPFISLQDAKNIDVHRVGEDLTLVTEQRAIAGGNGDGGGIYRRADGQWGNSLRVPVPTAKMTDAPGPLCKSAWHHIEVSMRLNRIVDGKAIRDGHLAYAIDGRVVLERRDVVFRTAQNADMRFNQFIIGPWSDGAPVEQTFWVDDLTVSVGAADHLPPTPAPTP